MCNTKFKFDFFKPLTLIPTKEESPRLISSCKIPYTNYCQYCPSPSNLFQ